jgi:glycosyltransferase involved in cell wall biosynthesis/predicted O-methyltransferase YrrM
MTSSQDWTTMHAKLTLAANDYVSPGLAVVTPDAAFPDMMIGNTSLPRWPWLRRWVEHNWYTDRRNPEVGFLSRDEAAILYNNALLFRDKPCLEVGCWRGWSAVHLALGAGELDIIDPVFADPDFAESVRASCEAAGVLDKVAFHTGFSPGAINELSKISNKRWSLIFIDGDHEGDAPRLDAEAAMRHADDTAMVIFHDLASPHVAAGLDAMRNAGWRTMVYQTMQIMGVAWRGSVEPVRHIPDPKVFWTLPRHLSGYEVSGWKRSFAREDGAWWPHMTSADRRDAAMMRAQAAEDDRSTAIAERDVAITERDVAIAHAEVFELKATGMVATMKQQEISIQSLEASLRRALELGPTQERQKNLAILELARWIVRKRILIGMLRRSRTERVAVLRTQAARIGVGIIISDAIVSWLTRSRVLMGLLRRSETAGNALVGFQLLQSDLAQGLHPAEVFHINPERFDTNRENVIVVVHETSRTGAHPAEVFHINPERFDTNRENVIVVVHETSRTGAPILGWNIAKHLATRYNIFTVRLDNGALTPEFEALSAETHGPFLGAKRNATDIEYGLRPLFKMRTFRYAIVNSSESRLLLEVCSRHRVPTLFLMHEFGSYVYPAADLRSAFDCATEIVFPARMVARSSEELHPPLKERNIRILPQGMSDIPSWNKSSNPDLAAKLLELSGIREAGAFIVIGAGSIILRKGVDLFLATAAGVQRSNLSRRVYFVWVGHGYAPEADMGYSIYLKEQLQRSSLEGEVTFLGEVSDLEPIYALADTFLLTSRLDPLPNVSIDAAYRSIPIVCFEGASGTAEIMLADPVTATGVVPYLDTEAAGRVIGHLASNDEARRLMAEATGHLAHATFNMKHYVEQLDDLGSMGK